MTYEKAYYYWCLLGGCLGREEYEAELERLQLEEEPLSSLVIELSFCPSDRNRTLHLLREYWMNAGNELDYGEVLKMLRDFLRRSYLDRGSPTEDIVRCMCVFPACLDFNCAGWSTLCYLCDYYDLVDDDFIPKEGFDRALRDFIISGTEWDPFPEIHKT